MKWIKRTGMSTHKLTTGRLYPVVECYPNGGYLIIDNLGGEYITIGSSILWEVIGNEVGSEDNAERSVHTRKTLSDSR